MSKVVRAVKSLVGFTRLVGDMDRLDAVFRMAETLKDDATLDEGVAFHGRTPEGSAALRDRPRIGPIDLAALRKLPEGTLGRVYAEHMIANKLDPSAIPTLPSRDAREFLFAHYYETHDVWHAVTGYATDVAGELGLQAFYLAHGPARLSAMILAAGLLNTIVQPGMFDDRDRRMAAVVHGWLMGRRAKSLFGVQWNQLWSVPVTEIRARFAIDLAAADARVGEAVSVSTIVRPATPYAVAAAA